MKTTHFAAASGIVLAIALGGPNALAEQHEQGMQESQNQQGQQQGETLSKQAIEITDAKVVNRDGDDIGEVDEIVKGQDGKRYVVLTVGGWFDIGDKDIVIPLDQLSMQDALGGSAGGRQQRRSAEGQVCLRR